MKDCSWKTFRTGLADNWDTAMMNVRSKYMWEDFGISCLIVVVLIVSLSSLLVGLVLGHLWLFNPLDSEGIPARDALTLFEVLWGFASMIIGYGGATWWFIAMNCRIGQRIEDRLDRSRGYDG